MGNFYFENLVDIAPMSKQPGIKGTQVSEKYLDTKSSFYSSKL